MICLDAWMHCTSVRYDARLVKMVALAVIHSPLPIDPRQTLGPPLPETKAILPIIVGSGHLGQQRVKEFFSRSAFQGNWSRGTRTTTMVDFTRYGVFHLFIPTTMIIDCHLHQAADVGAACSCGLLSSKTSIRGRHLNCHLS